MNPTDIKLLTYNGLPILDANYLLTRKLYTYHDSANVNPNAIDFICDLIVSPSALEVYLVPPSEEEVAAIRAELNCPTHN